MHLKERIKKLKRDIPAVYLAIKDHRTPWIAKAFGGLTIVYALSPIDLIPDFIPIIGWLDDLIILPLLIALTIKFIPQPVMEEYRIKSQNLWKNGEPTRWLYAIPFLLIWIFIIYLIIIKLVI